MFTPKDIELFIAHNQVRYISVMYNLYVPSTDTTNMGSLPIVYSGVISGGYFVDASDRQYITIIGSHDKIYFDRVITLSKTSVIKPTGN